MVDLRRDPTACAAGRATQVRRRARVDDRLLELASDLSADLEITAEELDAIARLLGDDLKTFLCEG